MNNVTPDAIASDKLNTNHTEHRAGRLGTRHWVFIGSVVALDFAIGQLSKSLLHASGVTNFIRVDMFIPVVLWMLTRLIVDRFGVLTAYQFGWGTLAIFAFPGAMLPGPHSSSDSGIVARRRFLPVSALPPWTGFRVRHRRRVSEHGGADAAPRASARTPVDKGDAGAVRNAGRHGNRS